MDKIMAFEDHYWLKYIHDSRFPRQSKDKVFVFKMFVNLAGSGINLVRCMQHNGDMKNSWTMFDHVEQLRNWTMMVCHVYDNKYCKILTTTCCDMQSKNAQAIPCSKTNLMQWCSIMVSLRWILRVHGRKFTCKLKCCEEGLWLWWSNNTSWRVQAYMSFPLDHQPR